MGDNTAIEWTDATWNPVTGCTKVSDGCKHCYAERDWARLSANPATRYHGRAFTNVRCHDDVLGLPLRWRRPRRIFVNSMSDLFHQNVPDEFIDQVFAVMALAPQHTFQVLTKRPERMLEWATRIRRYEHRDGSVFHLNDRNVIVGYRDWPLPNVWLGVSVDDQFTADERIPLLLKAPAAVRWISAEPLLGPINLRLFLSFVTHGRGGPHKETGGLDWVVCGGESGPKARPMHPFWVRSLRDQCAAAGVPFLFKQWGEWGLLCDFPGADKHGVIKQPVASLMGPQNAPLSDFEWMAKIGKKAAGRLLDGKLHDDYPRQGAA
ncbi:MAG: phage Gp37/Gp68 family protein [Pseudomonadota bacterium]